MATHERVAPGQQSTIEAHRRDLRHRSRNLWERVDGLGEEEDGTPIGSQYDIYSALPYRDNRRIQYRLLRVWT